MYVPDIRFCDDKDLNAILNLNAESPWPWPESVIKYDFSPASTNELTYIGAFSHPSTQQFASKPINGDKREARGDMLLGFAVLGREKDKENTFMSGRTGILMQLIVDRKYRRRGIASQLIMAVSDCADYLGYKNLALRVRRSNMPAQNLYKKFNFHSALKGAADIIRGYYSDGEDALVMTAHLPLNMRNNKIIK